MVSFSSSDVINVNNFAYAWRLTDSQGDTLLDVTQQRILPLSMEYSAQVCHRGAILRSSILPHVNGLHYHVVSAMKLDEEVNTHQVEQWMRSLPVNADEEFYISWGNGVSAIVEWNTFIQNWDVLWYPFDIVYIFDDSLSWGILLGPEEFAVFVKRGGIDKQSSNEPFALGYRLVKAG